MISSGLCISKTRIFISIIDIFYRTSGPRWVYIRLERGMMMKFENIECREFKTSVVEFFSTEELQKKNIEDTYVCSHCLKQLFSIENKKDEHIGWPITIRPFSSDSIMTRLVMTGDSIRTEIICSDCGAHLGYVIQENVKTRYCIESKSVEFNRLEHH
jgi:peptide methionine sulfoxide reductase MsrB